MDFDLVTIGAGSGGVRASRVAAGQFGARVGVVEDAPLGGTCVNVGCIPKKLFVYASHFSEAFRDAAAYGWSREHPAFDWPTLRDNKNAEILRLNGIYERVLESSGARILRGRGRILDAHTVQVGDDTITTERILVATGGSPYVPSIPGAELLSTSDDMFFLDELPRHAVVVGGGYIAVEFAGILRGLGVDVVQLYRGPLFLRGFDGDLRRVLAEQMREKGVDLRFEENPSSFEKADGRIRIHLESGGSIDTDLVLCATGRVPNTKGLGLEEAGVELGPKGEVVVDAWSRASVDGIWAVGDCTDRIALTPVAIAEGQAAARSMFGGELVAPDHFGVPSAVFSQPPIATVGLTEEDAREAAYDVAVFKSEFRPLLHTLTGENEKTLVKLVVDAKTDRVLGAHMIGEDAAEIIQGVAVALKCGATKAQFDATVGIHPTSAEEFTTL